MAQTASEHLNDDELLTRSASGDEEAFLALYHRRHAALYRFAQHMSGSETVAEEVTQEVFLSLLRKPDGYDPSLGSLSAYLFGIARNQIRRHFDQGTGIDLDENDEEIVCREAGILANLTRAETIGAVRKAVATLPENYREVVALCDLQEVSYQEASECLGIPLGTVRSRLNRGRALLVKKLSPNAMRCTV